MFGVLSSGGVLLVLRELLFLRVAGRGGVGRVDDQRESARMPVTHFLDGGAVEHQRVTDHARDTRAVYHRVA